MHMGDQKDEEVEEHSLLQHVKLPRKKQLNQPFAINDMNTTTPPTNSRLELFPDKLQYSEPYKLMTTFDQKRIWFPIKWFEYEKKYWDKSLVRVKASYLTP